MPPIRDLLFESSGRHTQLPPSLLPEDGEYVFTLRVRDRFDRFSSLATHAVSTSSQPLPRVLIGGGARTLSIPSDRPLRLGGRLSLSTCFPARLLTNVSMRFEWTISGGDAVPRWERASPYDQTIISRLTSDEAQASSVPTGFDSLNRSRRVLALPAASLSAAAHNYTLTFSAYVELPNEHLTLDALSPSSYGGTILLAASADLTLSVRAPAPTATIAGGDRLVFLGDRVRLSVLPSASLPTGLQPNGGWTYRWLCTESPCAVNGSALETLLATLGGATANFTAAAQLDFDANDLLPSAAAAATGGTTNFSFVFVAQAADDGYDAGYGLSFGASQRAVASCLLQVSSVGPAASGGGAPAEPLHLRIGTTPASGRHNPNERVVLFGRLGTCVAASADSVTAEVTTESAGSFATPATPGGSIALEWTVSGGLGNILGGGPNGELGSSANVERRVASSNSAGSEDGGSATVGWGGAALVIPAFSLGGGGGVFSFWLHARDSSSGELLAAAAVTISLNEPPLHGGLDGGDSLQAPTTACPSTTSRLITLICPESPA